MVWVFGPLRSGRVRVALLAALTSLAAAAAAGHPAAALATVGTWTPTGSMSTTRQDMTASLLHDGRVLVAGGRLYNGSETYRASAELYDPASGTFSPAASMSQPRSIHTATVLADGDVVVSGGYCGCVLASSERYHPATDSWSASGSLTWSTNGHAAALLGDGRVLAAGGGSFFGFFANAATYDPVANVWTAAPPMSDARYSYTATSLANGEVLVAGGYDGSTRTATAQLFDPTTNTWSSAGAMSTPRSGQTATLLPSGKVLVAGGYGPSGVLASAELYDPTTNTWSPAASMSVARQIHVAALLPGGRVLVAGGYDASSPLASAEVYDPASDTWTTDAPMSTPRGGATATTLADGRVLVVGGNAGAASVASAELYEASNQPPNAPGTPTVSSGAAVNDGAFGLSWSAATDPEGSPVTYVLEHHAAGDPGFTVVASGLTSPTYAFTPGSREAQGTWQYRVRASDGALSGGVSGESVPVTVDRTDPSVSIACPSPDPIRGTSATATWTASDAESGLATPAAGTLALDTSTVGPHVATAPTAIDAVGHMADAICVYDVRGDLADEVAADDPQNSWRLGETSGTTMTAAAGASAGSYKNGVVLGQPGPLAGDPNGAALFNGTSSYASVNGVAAPASAYTMEILMKASAALQSGSLMDQGGAGALYVKTDRFCFRQTSTQVCWPSAPATGVWYHVAGTWDHVSKVARLYVDGVERASATAPTAPSGSGTLYIGYGQSAPWFKGLLDEPAYYATALSAARIATHYAACGC